MSIDFYDPDEDWPTDIKATDDVKDKALLAKIRKMPCLCCARRPSQAHHVTTRKNFGVDAPDNVMNLCVFCHYIWHFSGPSALMKKYPVVKDWLLKMERHDILAKCLRLR